MVLKKRKQLHIFLTGGKEIFILWPRVVSMQEIVCRVIIHVLSHKFNQTLFPFNGNTSQVEIQTKWRVAKAIKHRGLKSLNSVRA